ncbi:hypothetical protein ODS41_10335 [Pyrobaculum sp. 3827-6]|uniref:hypothetical protein n=1 Tax=Pyrobaculum sp. 3827-6 TaxID=2983604 RepID=UPI0021D84530|nr:hypothetical protein [Pyrobaculum sp. 3827-6]MCU7788307.1 hypothetical protein [Pyrobaculum sp. 3827-6]
MVERIGPSAYRVKIGDKIAEVHLFEVGAFIVLEDKTVIEYDGERIYVDGKPTEDQQIKALVEAALGAVGAYPHGN